MEVRDGSPVLTLFGVLYLLIGLAAAFLGPTETYCFYLFSAGGQFHYEGFGSFILATPPARSWATMSLPCYSSPSGMATSRCAVGRGCWP